MRAKKWIVALLTLGMLLTSLPAFAEEAITEPAAEEYSEPAAVESPALAVEPEELTAAPVDAPMSAEGEADLASLFQEGEQEADLTQFMEPTEEVPEAPLADAAPQVAEAAPASIEELPDGTLICQPPEEYCAVDVDSDLTDGDLFAGYASRLFYGQRYVPTATTNAGINLTGCAVDGDVVTFLINHAVDFYGLGFVIYVQRTYARDAALAHAASHDGCVAGHTAASGEDAFCC